MTSQPQDPEDRALAEDLAVLDAAARGGAWLRAVLCTLARRGVALRLRAPARARAILRALEVSPLYKGGQFLFDLLEWEDFMVEGPPPPVVATALDARAVAGLAAWMRSLAAALDGGLAPATVPVPGPEVAAGLPEDLDLPALEAGFHLYQDVVLGVVRSLGPLLAAAVRRPA